LSLSVKALQHLLIVGHALREDLQGHFAPKISLDRFVNDGHSPPPEFLFNIVLVGHGVSHERLRVGGERARRGRFWRVFKPLTAMLALAGSF